jgi:RHH-type proline utilization regulon transcriptional repressor/proline dehydrogenase/delta 1-pyrroline-5-carboxylate dehydrogenase
VGCPALAIAPGLSGAEGLDGILDPRTLSRCRSRHRGRCLSGATQIPPGRSDRRLQAATVAILPLITASDIAPFCVTERHLCIDTTASGGNASLLAQVG